jgi:hypothetical protein
VAKRKRAAPATMPEAPHSRTQGHRPSGVQRVATVWEDSAPTQELLDLFSEGDEEGAALAALRLYAMVPRVVGNRTKMRDPELDARARWLVPFMNGDTRLGAVLEASALPESDAVHALCVLLRRGIVVLGETPPQNS